MYHSITFKDLNGNSRNTWDDWYLIPSSRPVVASPGFSPLMVQIPGRSGAVDMTEYLTGNVVYGDRSGSFEFYVDNDHIGWVALKDEIINFIHGKRLRMILEDDANYYYEGRFSFSEWKSENWNSKVVINYIVGPYKKHVDPSGPQLWDPFLFDEDITMANEETRM